MNAVEPCLQVRVRVGALILSALTASSILRLSVNFTSTTEVRNCDLLREQMNLVTPLIINRETDSFGP